MSKIIPFNNNNEEESCDCPVCDLVEEFTLYLHDSESSAETDEIIRDLVDEAMKLGQKQLLINQLNQNAKLLDFIDGVCDCEECDGSCDLD